MLALHLRCSCPFASKETLPLVGQLLLKMPSLISAIEHPPKCVSGKQVWLLSFSDGKLRPSKPYNLSIIESRLE